MKHTKDNPEWETNLMSKTTWVTVALGTVAVIILILAGQMDVLVLAR